MAINSKYYPSTELCNKLTSIWFPNTEKNISHYEWSISWEQMEKNKLTGVEYKDIETLVITWVLPSVMEMLEYVPAEIKMEKFWECYLKMQKDAVYYTTSYDYDSDYWVKEIFSDTLPNAMAEMVIWLYENNFISFNK